MKTLDYTCPDCGHTGAVQTSDTESDLADALVSSFLKSKRCDECSRLGGARIDAYRRLRALEDGELQNRGNAEMRQVVYGRIQAQVRSIKLLTEQIKVRADVPLLKSCQIDKVDNAPDIELPF